MRVTTSSSFHCPSYCFCVPPPPPPQPLLPTQPALPLPPAVSPPSQCHHTSCRSLSGSPLAEERLCDENGGKRDVLLKSSLKKTISSAAKEEIVKECVKWTDDLGKELVEVREFEPIESGELDDEIYGYPTCACVIL